MPEQIPLIRIFISSPSDVSAERKIALEVIEHFPNKPAFREKVSFRVIAWDKPGAGTAMLGTLTPQEAINRGLPKPSECDIVLVIFWSKLGTSFTAEDGRDYLSGTHWELLDALNSPRPETLIFRRIAPPDLKDKTASEMDQIVARHKEVGNFFGGELFVHPDGKPKRGVNEYVTPDDFRNSFEIYLEELVLKLLQRDPKDTLPAPRRTEPVLEHPGNITDITTQSWPKDKSPFPGLRAFKEDDASIFFGRGRETDALVQQVKQSRFVAVVGASGSGKSSLVGAGLIHRLKGNAIQGSADWLYTRFTPAGRGNPFEAIIEALMKVIPAMAVADPFEREEIIARRAQRLLEKPESLVNILHNAFQDRPEHVRILLFIDQFEELFTLVSSDESKDYIQPFAKMLLETFKQSQNAALYGKEAPRIHIVATMRHDFYYRAVETPDLAEILRADAVFSLAAPSREAMRMMIERPAERAGMAFEEGLVSNILEDTKDGNALALMAYALDELYKVCKDQGKLTYAAYEQTGGVQGAIGKRANTIFQQLSEPAKNARGRVFRALVNIDDTRVATRRRTLRSEFRDDKAALELIDCMTDGRLLIQTASDDTRDKVIEVAHEALFHRWETLRNWIEENQDDHYLLYQVEREARQWVEHDVSPSYLWSQDRLLEVYRVIDRQGLEPTLEETIRRFITPEHKRYLDALNNTCNCVNDYP